MKLMSYTSAMQQGFVPRLQSMMPQAPQGPSLAGGMLGVGVGQEGDGSLIPTPQGGAGGDALKELLPRGPGRRKRSPVIAPSFMTKTEVSAPYVAFLSECMGRNISFPR